LWLLGVKTPREREKPPKTGDEQIKAGKKSLKFLVVGHPLPENGQLCPPRERRGKKTRENRRLDETLPKKSEKKKG